MALTVTEASAVNKLCDWLLSPQHAGPPDAEARDALALLADAAHKRLLAGHTGDDVTRRWDSRRAQGVAS